MNKLKKELDEYAPNASTDLDTIVVDTTDPSTMHGLVNDTRCVATFAGPFWKYGSKVVKKKSDLPVGDFVMITGAGRLKYSIVESFVSKHRVSVRMLIKRNKDGNGTIGNQVQNLGNLVHLHTPVK